MTTREQAIGALLTLLTSTSIFPKYGRRLRDTESIPAASTPALYIKTSHEEYERPNIALPPIRHIFVEAFIYIDVSGDVNSIPDAVLDTLNDQIDVLMQPDDLRNNRLTLGGLVTSAMIKGKVERAAGDVTGKGVLIIPIEIVIP